MPGLMINFQANLICVYVSVCVCINVNRISKQIFYIKPDIDSRCHIEYCRESAVGYILSLTFRNFSVGRDFGVVCNNLLHFD